MIYSRLDLPHHFTASGLVLAEGHLLLVNHRRIGAWVPPGGHIEPGEMPEETVVREIEEETGLKVEVVTEPMPQTGDEHAFFLARPLFVQSVIAVERGETVYHVDLAYLCRPLSDVPKTNGLPTLSNNPEVKESRWIALNALESVPLAKNVREIVELIERAKSNISL